jgi:hypothetical protein
MIPLVLACLVPSARHAFFIVLPDAEGGRHPKIAHPYRGAIFKKEGSSKDQARTKQGSSKDDFSKKYYFVPLATPKYGGALNQISIQGVKNDRSELKRNGERIPWLDWPAGIQKI